MGLGVDGCDTEATALIGRAATLHLAHETLLAERRALMDERGGLVVRHRHLVSASDEQRKEGRSLLAESAIRRGRSGS